MAGQDYKSLRELAKDIQSNLQKYAPIDTGNLRAQLRRANSVNSIIGKSNQEFNLETKSKDLQVSVEVSPNGAEYGMWFNDPPSVKSKRRQSLKRTAERKGNWDFGKRALDDAIYKHLEKFADEIAENMALQIEETFNNI
jgi:septum formation topological specificity factor MinE